MIGTSECFLWQTVCIRLQCAKRVVLLSGYSHIIFKSDSHARVSPTLCTHLHVYNPCFDLTRHVDVLWLKLSRTHSRNHSNMVVVSNVGERARVHVFGVLRTGLQQSLQHTELSILVFKRSRRVSSASSDGSPSLKIIVSLIDVSPICCTCESAYRLWS